MPRRAALLGVLTALAMALMMLPASAAPDVEQQPPEFACTYNNTRDVQKFPTSLLGATPWPQQYLGYEQAQKYSTGQGVIVAVIDSGIQGDTAQLHSRVYSGYDLTGATDRVGANTDCFAHGTAAASIIGAAPMAGIGFVGVAPGVLLLPIRQTWGIKPDGSKAVGSVAKLIRGIYVAVNSGARVINISITVDSAQLGRQALIDFAKAADYALQRNVVIVAASGNSSEQAGSAQVVDTYPAALAAKYPNVIAVGGIDRNGNLYKESVYGHTPWVSVVAPAEDVIVDFINKGQRGSLLTNANGTSYAAPFVTGTVALLEAKYRGITPAQVRQRIEQTADHPSTNLPDPQLGWGVIDPVAALTTILPASGPTPSPRINAPLPPPVKPDHSTRDAAITAAGLAAILAALLVGAAVVIPRGRRRHWRPGRRTPAQP